MNKFIIFLFFICSSLKALATESIPAGSVHDSNVTLTKAIYPSFADIVEPLMPAVVNIYTVKYNKKSTQPQESPFPNGFPFDHFNDLFEQFNTPFRFDEMYSNPKALGSGFIIDSSGFIVTNDHVVGNADEIRVKLTDNTEFPAKLIGTDQKTDLALLKVDTKNPLPFVKFGDSSKSRVGDWVIAIGNPFGLGGTVTAGIISSKGRDIGIDKSIVDDFIQTDAAINGGNSGGPMFNISGEVIGINTAIFSPSGTNVGIGFAIPSNTAQAIIEQLKSSGKVSRGRLDVYIQEVTEEIAEGLGLKEATGALVVDVQPGGSGDKAGIKAGDIIIEFAGQQVKNSRKLQVIVAETPIDKEIKIVVIRNGKNHELIGKITESSSSNEVTKLRNKKKDGTITDDSLEKSNVTFTNLTDELRKSFNLREVENAVIVTKIGKDAESYGFRIGDLIMAVNHEYIYTIDDLSKSYDVAKAAKKKNIVLLVKRRKTNIFIALPVL